MIHCRPGSFRVSYLAVVLGQTVKRLRACYLMHKMTIDVYNRQLPLSFEYYMRIIEFLIKSLSHN